MWFKFMWNKAILDVLLLENIQPAWLFSDQSLPRSILLPT